jgi:hypothetical protein
MGTALGVQVRMCGTTPITRPCCILATCPTPLQVQRLWTHEVYAALQCTVTAWVWVKPLLYHQQGFPTFGMNVHRMTCWYDLPHRSRDIYCSADLPDVLHYKLLYVVNSGWEFDKHWSLDIDFLKFLPRMRPLLLNTVAALQTCQTCCTMGCCMALRRRAGSSTSTGIRSSMR